MDTNQELLDCGIDLYLQDGKLIDDDLAADVDQIIIEEELSSAHALVSSQTDREGTTWQQVQFGNAKEETDQQNAIISLGSGDLVRMVQLMIDIGEARLVEERPTNFKFVMSATNPRFVISGSEVEVKEILKQFPDNPLWHKIEKNRIQREDLAELSTPQIVLQNP